jgi:hypothetical protein
VTGLSSTGGGALTLAQSSRISAPKDEAANAIRMARAAAAVPRNKVRKFNIVLSLDLSNPSNLSPIEFGHPLSAESYAAAVLDTTNLSWDQIPMKPGDLSPVTTRKGPLLSHTLTEPELKRYLRH